MSHRQDVRRAGERLRAADADFSACAAARSSCERELEVVRAQLRTRHHHDGWRRWRTTAGEGSELRGYVADAKARLQQARDAVQSAWERLDKAKGAYMRALVAHNVAVRSAAGEVKRCERVSNAGNER